ncbi:MAG TPA: hypothetical protein PKD64_07565 [Pirellulaceae bacterium]|nr:hypothetical protein [Pirellulaceae bacterium]HMO92044.1 hypothetical protein [Pirellulaceae bacterium]HMP68843.1 hypothetical protein [Pirellulaceae bacterium]
MILVLRFWASCQVACLILALFGAILGCTAQRTSDTSRTGIEQLLISNAIDQTLDRTPLPPVEGRKVFIDSQYLDAVDKGYLVGTIRHRLLQQGAQLVDAKDGSEITLEVRSGGVGTDNTSSFIGMPAIAMPGPMPLSLPEVRLFDRQSQFGTAKIGIVAYETETGSIFFDSGRSLARASDNKWSVLGLGPFQTGEVRDEVNAATNRSSFTTRLGNAFSPTKTQR